MSGQPDKTAALIDADHVDPFRARTSQRGHPTTNRDLT